MYGNDTRVLYPCARPSPVLGDPYPLPYHPYQDPPACQDAQQHMRAPVLSQLLSQLQHIMQPGDFNENAEP